MGTASAALRYRPAQALVIAGLSMLVTACVAFAPLYDRAMQQALVDQQLQQAPVSQRVVTVSSRSNPDEFGNFVHPLAPMSLVDELPAGVTRLLHPPVLGREAHVVPANLGDTTPDGPLIWRDHECDHIQLVQGSCPTSRGQVAVSATDVSNFPLSLGSKLRVEANDGTLVPLTIVGIYRPKDTEWWQGTLLVGLSFAGGALAAGSGSGLTHDAWLTSEPTFTAEHAPVLPGELSRAGYLLDESKVGVDELLDAADQLTVTNNALRKAATPVFVDTRLPSVASEVRTQSSQGHKTVPLLIVQLGLLFVVVLWLVLTAATDQRRQEVAVARLRGSGAAGARRLLLAELLPSMLAGVVPGALVAIAGCAVVRDRLPGNAPFELTPLFWAAFGVAVAVLVLLAATAAYRVSREPLETLLRRPSSRMARWALGALDAVVVAAAGTGAVAFVTGSLTGPLVLIGPALLALAVGLVLAHLASPAALVLGRGLLRRGRMLSGTGVLDAARSPATRRTLTVVTVACALVVFATAALAIGDRNWQALSEHQAGAAEALELQSTDLGAVRSAVHSADPSGHRATAVAITGSTLAVEPDAFRRIALFPDGAPTTAQWAQLRPPDVRPIEVTGGTIALTASTSQWMATDITNEPAAVRLSVQVADPELVRDVSLGVLPPSGRRVRLSTITLGCQQGCEIIGLSISSLPGAYVKGNLSISQVTVDGKPVTLASSATDWSRTSGSAGATTDSLAAAPTTSPGHLDLKVQASGAYPFRIQHAWVPVRVPALVADRATGTTTIDGLDGEDRAAEAVGTLALVPTMPMHSQLVDLAAIERGANLSPPARLEVWLDSSDARLVSAVTDALDQRHIAVSGTRSLRELQASYHGTVGAWSLDLAAGVGVTGMLAALLSLLVLTVTGWRRRSRDLAALRMAGVRRRTLSALAIWSQLPAVVLAALAGIVCGLVGVHVAMPTVPLFVETPDVDIIDLGTPWLLALVTAAVCVVVLVAAAAAAGRAVARRARLDRVKETV